jgi:outer membrane protein
MRTLLEHRRRSAAGMPRGNGRTVLSHKETVMRSQRYLIVLFILSLVSLAAATSPAVSAELKIGYIRPQYIFSKYEPYKEAQKQLDDFKKSEDAKLQKMTADYDAQVKDMESKSILMTEEILKTKREELQKQKEQLDSIYNDLYKKDGRLDSKQKELITPVLDRINTVILRIGKNEGYDYILDAEGSVLYANTTYDMSDYVLQEIAKETPKK